MKMNNINNRFSRSVKFKQLLQHSSEEEIDQESTHYYSSSITSSPRSSSPRLSSFNNNDNDNYFGTNSPSPYNFIMSLPLSVSPYLKSLWIKLFPTQHYHTNHTIDNIYFSRGRKCWIGSLLREEGHVYSLVVKDGMLYIGSKSKKRSFYDAGWFKSGSELVKAIVIFKDQQVLKDEEEEKQ
ncbi:unnamed protein product [Amaranthus hypochondriacus]